MGLLTPLFLAGAAALAIPVLIHLVQKDRSKIVAFPSLMFLERIEFKASKRRKIEHWFLLLLRALAVLLLVAAFTRPYFEGGPLAAGTGLGPKELVILVDRSYSMGLGDNWENAVDAARDALDGFGTDDRASLILFQTGADAPFRSSTEPARLRASIDTLQPGDGATRYGPGLKLAQSILEESTLPNLEVVVVSDFQRNGWRGDEGVSFPPGTVVTPVSVASPDEINRTVRIAELQRERVRGLDRLQVSARVTQTGGDAASIPVTLELDGRDVQTVTVELAADEPAIAVFDPFTIQEENTLGRVRVDPDVLPADDEARFVASPAAPTKVMVVEDPRATAGSSLYLTRALEASEGGSFEIQTMPDGRFSEAVIDEADVVILNDVPIPTGPRGDRLREFVESGGGLFVAAGERSNGGADAAELVPATIGAPQDREETGGGRLGHLDFSHPALELFSQPGSGDFTSVRVFRSRPLDPDSSAVVVARWDDGSAALLEGAFGDGHVLVWGATLDNFWTDFPLQPVYLPFVHQVVRHLSGRSQRPDAFMVGDVRDLDVIQRAGGARGVERVDEVATTPSGETIELAADADTRFLELEEQGFYQVRPAEERPDRPLTLAVNVDPAESDLATLDLEELVGSLVSVVPIEGDVFAGTQDVTDAQKESRQSLWRWILLLAAALLVIETVVSNRLYHGAMMPDLTPSS